MCGIAGIVSENVSYVSRQRLQAMTDAIKHRGPEGDGFWLNPSGNIGFGHRRLSIIDLSKAGAQPMHYQQRYTITYNGELYNFPELKQSLKTLGYHFYSQCDTEVVVAAYACYGKDCLQYFDGMFAFAIWDEQEKVLFCARDRFGEKPFFYHYNSKFNQLLFASEMKALWAAGVSRCMDNEMLLNYLTLGSVQNPVNRQQTFFEDVISLPPAHYLLCNFKSFAEPYLELANYWDLDKVTVYSPKNLSTACEEFQHLFQSSVNRRLRSDVPVGSSLSGGLDSSSIVATMNQLLGNPKNLLTFSAVFPGFEKDESAAIKEVTKYLALQNRTITPTANGLIEDFDKLLYHQEEPFQSASIYAQYKVYELARKHNVTVILDGQGADEVLAGYTKYYHWFWQQKIRQGQWRSLRHEIRCARGNGQPVQWSYKNIFAAYLPQVAANFLQEKQFKQQRQHPHVTADFFAGNYNKHKIFKPGITSLNDILYYNTMQHGLQELLRYADRNSMAHSREVRLPLLSHELVQYIFSLPADYKICNGFTKYILRKSAETQLPPAVTWRRDKVGYEPPQKQWMQEPAMHERIFESRKKLVEKGVLKKEVLQQPVQPQNAHEAGNFDWRYLCAASFL